MRFLTFIETCFSIMLLSGICLPDDGAFISMTGDCKYPAIAAEGTNIVLTWLATEVRPASIYFQRSADEGKTWDSPRKISNANGDCLPPSIAVNSGTVHLAWVDCGEVIDGELYYTRSLDGGNTWEKSVIIVGNANSAQYPLIACGGSNVYLIWQDVQTQVFFKVSRDQGRTWENETLLGKVGKQSCYCFPPALSVNKNAVTVVWTDFKEVKGPGFRLLWFPLFKDNKEVRISSVVCRKSSDNGHTWSKEQILTSTKISKEMKDEIDNPKMFSDGSRSYLFWQDKHNLPLGEILYTGFDPSTEKGHIKGKALFSTPKRSPKCPSVVFDNDKNLHMTWTTSFGGESIVHYGAINPAGNILMEKKDLTSTVGRYQNPTITRTLSGMLHIFWFNEFKGKDKDKLSKIFSATSRDNGLTWENRGSQTEDVRN
jgi:Neuraminidase (sialidase)